jgi:hypothetical protein
MSQPWPRDSNETASDQPGAVQKQIVLGDSMARPRPKFTEEECKRFEEEATPHQWFLTADLLHNQAVELYARRGRGMLAKVDAGGFLLGQWDVTNKATFLLCAFALENAIKAFLVYEYPVLVSQGRLHDEMCNHKLVSLSEKSSLIPYAKRDAGVLAAFEEGNDSWMRYPCSKYASGLRTEPQLQDKLWNAYLRVMRGYGLRLMRLLGKGWKGSHGFAGSWQMSGGNSSGWSEEVRSVARVTGRSRRQLKGKEGGQAR